MRKNMRMQIFAKYAIECSHITGIPIKLTEPNAQSPKLALDESIKNNLIVNDCDVIY